MCVWGAANVKYSPVSPIVPATRAQQLVPLYGYDIVDLCHGVDSNSRKKISFDDKSRNGPNFSVIQAVARYSKLAFS